MDSIVVIVYILHFPYCCDIGVSFKVTVVSDADTLLTGDFELGFDGDGENFRGEFSTVKELAFVGNGDLICAWLGEDNTFLVGSVNFKDFGTIGGLYVPSVSCGAIEGNAIDDGFIDTSHLLAFYVDGILDDGDFLAEHRRACVATAEAAVESDDAVAVLRVVPLHGDGLLVLRPNDGATIDIPAILTTGRIVGGISNHGILTDGAVAAEVEDVAMHDFDDISFLIVATAVVVNAVDDLVFVPNIFDTEIGRGSGEVVERAIPEVADDVGVGGRGEVGELYSLALADVDYF